MYRKISYLLLIITLISGTGCNKLLDYVEDIKNDHKPTVTTFASGLIAPLGLEGDEKGRLWITEAGTGLTNDGQLSMINAQGKVFPVVKGFASSVSPEGAVFGLNHLILNKDTLWMLHGVEGKLYKFGISSFKPGDAPLKASDLKYEDVGTFVKNSSFKDDTNETDIFNLTIGPDGDLFIVDAAANAIIRRKSTTGALSVFATIPPITNPSGNPDQVQSVPTGIVFDGEQFLVCCFSGYPYPAKKATIYRVDLNGNAAVYQTGFSSLADIELGIDRRPVVIEYGTWTGETFAQNSGTIVKSSPEKNTQLVSGLNFPNAIKRSGFQTYYVAETYDGKILKVVF